MFKLRRVVPNEKWQLILDLGPDGLRLFDASIARKEKGWSQLAYPNKFKNLTYTDDLVRWGQDEELSSTWLHKLAACGGDGPGARGAPTWLQEPRADARAPIAPRLWSIPCAIQCTPLPRRAVDWGRPRGYRQRGRPVPNRPVEMERVETSLRAIGLPMGDPIHRGRFQRSTNAARHSCQGGMSARRGFVNVCAVA
jgi:hypothetical protein